MRVNRDGVNVYVDISGPDDAAPVVFLHGVSASGTVWDWLPRAVTTGRRVIKIDFRGHGRSDRATGTYLLPQFTDDVAAVLRAVVNAPAVLVGHSLGAVVAWDVAQHHPGLVTALFLEDPPLFSDLGPCSGFAALIARMRADADDWQRAGLSVDEIAKHLAAEPFGPTFGLTAHDLATDDAITASAFSVKHVDVAVLDAALDGSMLAARDTSAPVSVPVFILAADAALGAAFTPDHAKVLTEAHPSVEVTALTGAGHRIHVERASRPAFTRHLVDFLDRHSS
jgi:pimeloyl-ACP methyl ester carboxylesterase